MDENVNEGPSKMIIRLAINRIDTSIPANNEITPLFFTPGEEISTQPDFLR